MRYLSNTSFFNNIFHTIFTVLLSLLTIFPPNILCQESKKIVIIKSSSIPVFDLTCKEIASVLESASENYKTETKLLEKFNGSEIEFWEKIVDSSPSLILTVGSPATKSAFLHVRNIPIIYTMILGDLTNLQLDSSTVQAVQSSGISISIPIEKQLEILLDALPMIRRLGLLYSPNQENLYRSALEFSKKVNINLIGVQFDIYKDIPAALKTIISDVDALLLPPNVNIYQPEVIEYILKESFHIGIPVMAYSKQVAIAGSPLAISPDYKDIARQTAELAIQILSERIPIQKHQWPRTVILYINEGVSSSLGLYYSRKTLDKAMIISDRNSYK